MDRVFERDGRLLAFEDMHGGSACGREPDQDSGLWQLRRARLGTKRHARDMHLGEGLVAGRDGVQRVGRACELDGEALRRGL